MNNKDEIFAAALDYLAKGWSILPIGRDKKPLLPWKEYQTRLATPDEVSKWYNKFEDFGLAVATGKLSGITVLDVEAGGSVAGLPPTLMSRTQKGGWHFYYKYQPGVGNGVRIKDLTDCRGDGGYCVVPPSVCEKGVYEWLNDERPQPFPASFIPLVTKPVSTFKNIGRVAYISDAEKLPKYDGTAEGSRNNGMAKYIGRVLKMVHPADWDTVAAKAMLEANKLNNPPLAMRELESIYESIKNREKLNPSIRPSVVLSGNDDAIDDVVQMEIAAAAARPTAREFYPTGFSVIDESIGGGWKGGDLVVVTGRSGHGKTTLSETFAYNLIKTDNSVLFFSYEVLVDIVWDQFVKMGLNGGNLIFAPMKTTTGNLEWVEQKIHEGIAKFGVRAVVIDHLGFLAPPARKYSDAYSANYTAYLTQMCRDLKNLARDNKIVIFLLAHVKKTDMRKDISQEDISQSNGPLQESDFLFSIQRTPFDAKQGEGLSPDEYVEVATQNRKEGEELYGFMSKLSLLKNRMTGRSFWVNIRKQQMTGVDGVLESITNANGPFIHHISEK